MKSFRYKLRGGRIGDRSVSSQTCTQVCCSGVSSFTMLLSSWCHRKGWEEADPKNKTCVLRMAPSWGTRHRKSLQSPCLLNSLKLRAMFGEGNGTPLQYSCWENPMDGGAWWTAVHVVAKRQTWLSNFPFTFHFHALEKEMETHFSILAWRIPGTRETGGLLPTGSNRVGHDWSDLAAAIAMLNRKVILKC